MSDPREIELAFAPYIFLDCLVQPELADDFWSKASGARSQYTEDDLLSGWKLAVVSALHLYLDAVIRDPMLVGVKPDWAFKVYWAFTKEQGKDKLRKALRPKHGLSRVVAGVLDLADSVVTTRTWSEFQSSLPSVGSFSSTLQRIFNNSYGTLEKNADTERHTGAGRVLYERAADVLRLEMMSGGHASTAYAELYTGYRAQKRDEMCDEGPFAKVPSSHLDQPLGPSDRVQPHPRWGLGYVLAMNSCLSRTSPPDLPPKLNRLIDHFVAAAATGKLRQCSFDEQLELYSDCLENMLGRTSVWPAQSPLKLKRIRNVKASDRPGIVAPVLPQVTREQLAARFGAAMSVVETDYLTAPLTFRCALDGAIARGKRERKKSFVAEIKHPLGSNRSDYSYAILMPMGRGYFNASKWWVFYDVANDHSGHASKVLAAIQNAIEVNRRHVRTMNVEADKKLFAECCVAPGFLWATAEIKRLRDLHSRLRGALPELLLLAYLAAKGAHPVKNSFKPRFLNGKELDVVGVLWDKGRPSEIVVFESKGRANADKELRAELNKFNDKAAMTRKHLTELLEELESGIGLPSKDGLRLSAVFVSMTEFESGRIVVPEGVDLWDFTRFRSELASCHVSARYLSLLQWTILAYMFDDEVAIGDRLSGIPGANAANLGDER